MSNRKAAKSAAMDRRGWRSGLGGWALALLMMTWSGAPRDVRADTIVLKSGEQIEGSIIDATRNTVVVRRSIGGMRQMRIGDIDEVRIDLAPGKQIIGQFVSWADGVYQLSSGGELIWISEGAISSRRPSEQVARQPSRQPPTPERESTAVMAVAPAASAPQEPAAARAAPAREPTVAQKPRGEDRSLPAGEDQSPAAGAEQELAVDQKQSSPDGAEQSPPAGEKEKLAAVSQEQTRSAGPEQNPAAVEQRSPAAGEEQGRVVAAKQRPTAGEEQSLARDEAKTRAAGEKQRVAVSDNRSPAPGADQSPAAGEERRLAADQRKGPATDKAQRLAAVDKKQAPATDERQSLAVRASVDPAEPGADNMVFRIELSRPAEQTVVLIYGTVEGTAKAGEDFEPQQGMVTLAPGVESAEVRVPLIEHGPSKGEKRFELFLTADPKVAEVVDRRITATIDGGD